MFVCEECIKNYKLKLPKKYYPRSYGRCEDCRKTSGCYDVYHGHYMHIDSIAAKRGDEF